MAGAVQPPGIKFSLREFDFGAAPLGSIVARKFTIENTSLSCRAIVIFSQTDSIFGNETQRSAFELSEYRVELEGSETRELTLFFNPFNISDYNFGLEYSCNGLISEIPVRGVAARREIDIPETVLCGKSISFKNVPAILPTITSVSINPQESATLDENNTITHVSGQNSFTVKINNEFSYEIKIDNGKHIPFSLDTQVMVLPIGAKSGEIRLTQNSSECCVVENFSFFHRTDFMDISVDPQNIFKIQITKTLEKGFHEKVQVIYNSVKVGEIIVSQMVTTNSFTLGLVGSKAKALKSWIMNFIQMDHSLTKARRILENSADTKTRLAIQDSGIDFLINRLVRDNHEEARYKPIDPEQLESAYSSLLVWMQNNGANVHCVQEFCSAGLTPGIF